MVMVMVLDPPSMRQEETAVEVVSSPKRSSVPQSVIVVALTGAVRVATMVLVAVVVVSTADWMLDTIRVGGGLARASCMSVPVPSRLMVAAARVGRKKTLESAARCPVSCGQVYCNNSGNVKSALLAAVCQSLLDGGLVA